MVAVTSRIKQSKEARGVQSLLIVLMEKYLLCILNGAYQSVEAVNIQLQYLFQGWLVKS
jgi:hypothetical protein